MKWKERVKKLKQNLFVVWIALRRKDMPWYVKVSAGLTVCYALSPIDLIPDFIPMIGYLDDWIVLPLMIYITFSLIPKDTLEEMKTQIETQEISREKKWYYGLPIIAIWCALGCLLYFKLQTKV